MVKNRTGGAAVAYRSEAELERALIKLLQSWAYDYLPLTSEAELIDNLRAQLSALNGIEFSDSEWERFFSEKIAGAKVGAVEKTKRIREDHVQILRRDDTSRERSTSPWGGFPTRSAGSIRQSRHT